ncbi:MAG: NAD(P)/FAD-dependent oxidoreductase [Peptococcaceae bacterium]|nr:NAD(P)/FAD-dependent oxidoreductase [Peptococcaceae bacterium]
MAKYDVVIVGAGPAGIFAAAELIQFKSDLKVLLIDKGKRIEDRKCPIAQSGHCMKCRPCAIMNGWAGAGAFSDGKLSLSPEVGGQILEYISQDEAMEYIRYVDGQYLRYGAPEVIHGLNDSKTDEIAYEASRHSLQLIPCPVRHMGTERGFEVMRNMYGDLVGGGKIEFREHTSVSDILLSEDQTRVRGVRTEDADGRTEEIEGRCVVLAPGRGGAEWLAGQAKKLNLKSINNAVDIGLRVETPNSVMDHLTRDLYEAKIVYYADTFESKVRTFCMNPGGVVSEETYDGEVTLVNGHSYLDASRKTPNTNFALLVSTRFTEPFNQPIQYGKYIAQCANMLTGGGIMVQRLEDLRKGRRTDLKRLEKSTTIPTLKSAVPGDLSFVLPHRFLASIVETLRALDKLAPGLYSKGTLLYGVEAKFYSLQIQVKPTMETDIVNLYAAGDGAGITRGLMQASVTGVLAARDILGKIS